MPTTVGILKCWVSYSKSILFDFEMNQKTISVPIKSSNQVDMILSIDNGTITIYIFKTKVKIIAKKFNSSGNESKKCNSNMVLCIESIIFRNVQKYSDFSICSTTNENMSSINYFNRHQAYYKHYLQHCQLIHYCE